MSSAANSGITELISVGVAAWTDAFQKYWADCVRNFPLDGYRYVGGDSREGRTDGSADSDA